MDDFTIKDLDKILNYKTIKVQPIVEKDGYFERNREFTINNIRYRIEWWCNICYLYIQGDAQVIFSKIVRTNTWPNWSKMDLQFQNEHGLVVCILKIDEYPKYCLVEEGIQLTGHLWDNVRSRGLEWIKQGNKYYQLILDGYISEFKEGRPPSGIRKEEN